MCNIRPSTGRERLAPGQPGTPRADGTGIGLFRGDARKPRSRITPACLGLYSDENEAGFGAHRALSARATPSRIGGATRPCRPQGVHAAALGGWRPVRDEHAWTPVAPSPMPYELRFEYPRRTRRCRATRRFATIFVAACGAACGWRRHDRAALRARLISRTSSSRRWPITAPIATAGRWATGWRCPLELVELVVRSGRKTYRSSCAFPATDWMTAAGTRRKAILFARECASRGVDAIDCSSRAAFRRANKSRRARVSSRVRPANQARSEIATVAVGMISDPLQAEKIVASGDADFVAMARAFLRVRAGLGAARRTRRRRVRPQSIYSRPKYAAAKIRSNVCRAAFSHDADDDAAQATPPPSASPTASPAPSRRRDFTLKANGSNVFVNQSTVGPGITPPEGPGSSKARRFRRCRPTIWFSGAPVTPGVAASRNMRSPGSIVRGRETRGNARLAGLTGSTTNAAYWSEPLIPNLNIHALSRAVPFNIAFRRTPGRTTRTS